VQDVVGWHRFCPGYGRQISQPIVMFVAKMYGTPELPSGNFLAPSPVAFKAMARGLNSLGYSANASWTEHCQSLRTASVSKVSAAWFATMCAAS